MTKHRPRAHRSLSPLTTKALAAVCGGGITNYEMKRGQFEEAPHDQGIKVYIDVVY
jgi:hypothetical protein